MPGMTSRAGQQGMAAASYKLGDQVEAMVHAGQPWSRATVVRIEDGGMLRLILDGHADTVVVPNSRIRGIILVPPSRIRPANQSTSAAAPAPRAGKIQRKAPKWGLLCDSDSVYWFGAHDTCDFEALQEGDRVSFELRDNPNLAKRAQHPFITVSVAKSELHRIEVLKVRCCL